MSHYGDFYRADRDERLVNAYPVVKEWGVPYEIQVTLAEGLSAKKELQELKEALRIVKKAMEY